MRTWTVVVALLVSAGTARAATDHAAVVAAMKSEEQQCRYYVQRCEAGDIDGVAAVSRTLLAIYGRQPKCEQDCLAAMRQLIQRH